MDDLETDIRHVVVGIDPDDIDTGQPILDFRNKKGVSMKFQKVVKTVCEIEEFGEVIAVKNGDPFYFISTKEFHAACASHPRKNKIDLIAGLRHYIYLTNKELRDIFKNIQYQTFLEIVWDAYHKDPMRVIRSKTFDVSRVLYFDQSCHLFYPVDSDMPLSVPMYVQYIGGVDNRDYDLDKVLAILGKDSRVSEIQKIEIPYYNQDEDRTHAVEFKVLLPQKQYDSLVRHCRGLGKEFWSCRMKECLCYRSYRTEDLLKLKPAYVIRGEKE